MLFVVLVFTLTYFCVLKGAVDGVVKLWDAKTGALKYASAPDLEAKWLVYSQ